MNRRLGVAIAGGAVLLAAVACLSGCSNLGYYWQSATGHLRVMGAARPVDLWLADAQAPEKLKERLALSQRIRRYAVTQLHLPDNPSYSRYADLQRNAVVWNVVAAPPYSLTLKPSCFPVTGCVGYRGYFDEAEARAEAKRLAAEGLESGVYPVPAYSTLGWMNWAGGDPLLNTFINYPEGELARLIFHELAHQVVYAKDDTMFNESFATAVERLGGQMWLQTQASDTARSEYAQYDGRRNQFRAFTQATRKRLAAIYESTSGEERERQKQAAMKDFRDEYAKLRDSWPGEPSRYRAYDRWVAEANNASFGAQAAYDDLVPGFEALFAREGSDFTRFYDAAKRLAEVPKAERHQKLKGDKMSRSLRDRETGLRWAEKGLDARRGHGPSLYGWPVFVTTQTAPSRPNPPGRDLQTRHALLRPPYVVNHTASAAPSLARLQVAAQARFSAAQAPCCTPGGRDA